MKDLYITKLGRTGDFRIEIFVAPVNNTELEALQEAFRLIGREIIYRETHSY